MNSLLALQPEPHMVATSSARAGVLSLIKSLAIELAPQRIRVNSILIGIVESGQWRRRYAKQAQQGQSWEDWTAELARKKNIPLGRFGRPEEAAQALFYLATNAVVLYDGQPYRCFRRHLHDMSNNTTVGELIAAFLEQCGVQTAFGVISIHNMPILDAIDNARQDSLRRRTRRSGRGEYGRWPGACLRRPWRGVHQHRARRPATPPVRWSKR